MKVEIEKKEGGQVRLSLTYDAVKKPMVIEGRELENLVAMLAVAKSADRFQMTVEVR